MYIFRLKKLVNCVLKYLPQGNKRLYLVFVSVAVLCLSLLRPGYSVYINNENVATVKTKAQFEAVLASANDEIAKIIGQSSKIDTAPKYLFKAVPVFSFSEEADIVFNLMQIPGNISHACEITVDGSIAAYAEDKEAAEKAVRDVLESYDGTDKTVANKLEFKNVYIASFDVYSENSLFYSMKSRLDIKWNENDTREETVPFEVVQKENPKMRKGEVKVVQEGKSGKSLIDVIDTFINGNRVSVETLSETVTVAAVPQIEEIGTKAVSGTGSGTLSKPLAGGTVSSRYGARDGRRTAHKGIDIACSMNTPVTAADEGVVTTAEYTTNGYGKLIVIDHKNGYTTHYAHLDKISISVGDIVEKGQIIGESGNTGLSTGPHLHFEVRKNDVPCNPSEFISF